MREDERGERRQRTGASFAGKEAAAEPVKRVACGARAPPNARRTMDHAARLSPTTITASVPVLEQQGGLFASLELLCWFFFSSRRSL